MTLKDYLKNRNKEAFAADIGAHLSTVYRWINDETKPSQDYMLIIKEKTNGRVKPNDFYK